MILDEQKGSKEITVLKPLQEGLFILTMIYLTVRAGSGYNEVPVQNRAFGCRNPSGTDSDYQARDLCGGDYVANNRVLTDHH